MKKPKAKPAAIEVIPSPARMLQEGTETPHNQSHAAMIKTKAKPVAIEVIPSPARAAIDQDLLDKLVQQKVAEILTARDEFIFEPFFRSRQVSYEIRRLQTVSERKKWSIYYQRHGCVCCKESKRPYAGGCGMCTRCYDRVIKDLRVIVRELIEQNDGNEGNVSGRALLAQFQTPEKP